MKLIIYLPLCWRHLILHACNTEVYTNQRAFWRCCGILLNCFSREIFLMHLMLAVIDHHLLKISVNFLWDFLPVRLLLFLCFFHDSCGVKVQQSGQFKGKSSTCTEFPYSNTVRYEYAKIKKNNLRTWLKLGYLYKQRS